MLRGQRGQIKYGNRDIGISDWVVSDDVLNHNIPGPLAMGTGRMQIGGIVPLGVMFDTILVGDTHVILGTTRMLDRLIQPEYSYTYRFVGIPALHPVYTLDNILAK